MASKRICLWLVFMIITQAVEEDIRFMEMSLMPDCIFQCANTTCLPFINVITPNIKDCQVACLAQSQCTAAMFHRSTSICELFADMLNQNGNMLADVDVTTMITIAGTRFPPVCHLSSQSTWSQTATTIFGSQAGTSGSTLLLLNSPNGMYYDQPNNRLVVADQGNQRILQFSLNNPPSVATVIAGSNGQGCNMNQFNNPAGVGRDSSGQLYVADYNCNQIVRFPSDSNSATSGTLLASVDTPTVISVNQLTNDIYVLSNTGSVVYKFVGGSGPPVVAAGGNGYGNALNQFLTPNGVYYDYLYTNALYVTDQNNYRIMKFPSGSTSATYGTVVAGGNGGGGAANQLNSPRSIVVDSSGSLYIGDQGNNRVIRWLQNATSGTTIVGGTQGTASNQFNGLEQIVFDRYGNLLITDGGNNRIQLFSLTKC
ncbi:unnamed protein product [Adineta steineri]|uniref:Apple domain-containing protein n=1 Tax=Adineta steineri TaxID=433720 RepID=A0A819SBS2_9BILA|nr:unnamed protein product [Adineta steineri]CAF4054034.1 unnamed protein product [Adineta steineri]